MRETTPFVAPNPCSTGVKQHPDAAHQPGPAAGGRTGSTLLATARLLVDLRIDPVEDEAHRAVAVGHVQSLPMGAAEEVLLVGQVVGVALGRVEGGARRVIV